MGENLPVKFRKSSPANLASYSFIDLAEGTGVVLYYGASHKEQSTVSYYLSTTAMYSNDIQTDATSAGSPAAKVLDLDFDLKYNLPQVVKGKVRVNMPIGVYFATGSGNSTIYIIAKVRKVSNGVETDIASAQSESLSPASASTNNDKVVNVEIDVPQTQYRKNDTFRLTIELWWDENFSGTTSAGVAHDPKNRAPSGNHFDSTLPTQMTVLVPYRINL